MDIEEDPELPPSPTPPPQEEEDEDCWSDNDYITPFEGCNMVKSTKVDFQIPPADPWKTEWDRLSGTTDELEARQMEAKGLVYEKHRVLGGGRGHDGGGRGTRSPSEYGRGWK